MALPKISTKYVDPHSYPDGIAYADGQYVRIADAKISILDYGFLHSDATYDVVHVWKGSFFRLELYLDRFFAGMEKLHMEIPYSREDVTDILQNCVVLSGHQDAYVEMVCTRGTSPTFSRDPRDCINRFMAFAVPFGSVAKAEQMARGMYLSISDTVRIPPSSVDPSIKNYHWLDFVAGLYDAYGEGGETALLLNAQGHITEGPGFNVFCVKDNILSTPISGVLAGITRQSVFDLCEELNLECGYATLSPDDLLNADEVFITSTAGGVMPVSKINNQTIGAGGIGPLFNQIHTLYWQKHSDPSWSHKIEYER